MSTYHSDDLVTLHAGDCLDVMRAMPDASVDAICTDPPYGLGFMGKEWDDLPPGLPWARECLRVLKPGGHLLAFGGTRTSHRLACAVEDAGFEVRDSIAWLYGSGFPKSLDVSKAIDRMAGAEREIIGRSATHATKAMNGGAYGANHDRETVTNLSLTAPATPAAEQWQGWGTALKPAFEPIVVARKPLTGTVATNVLAHGTGALNIDGCRVATTDDLNGGAYRKESSCTDGTASTATRRSKDPMTPGRASDTRTPSPAGRSSTPQSPGRHDDRESWRYVEGGAGEYVAPAGRWPANVVLDESQAAELDAQSGESVTRSGGMGGTFGGGDNGMSGGVIVGRERVTPNDRGGASRFFYVAKADSGERVRVNGVAHPTVKPLALMRWLVRLVTPPGGTVLEPFAGSGTTVEACLLEGFRCIAIEREADYLPLIMQRFNRRRNPVEAVKASGEDGGLFDLLGEVPA